MGISHTKKTGAWKVSEREMVTFDVNGSDRGVDWDKVG